MIVTCPNCTTRLQLDGAKVPARPFSVRCPKCQQIVNAQPPAQSAPPQRDALAAIGDVPASTKSQQETAAATPAPLVGEAQESPDGHEDVLRLLASLLRREAAGGGVRGASVAGDAAQAAEHMREDQPDVLVLDPEFDVRSQGSMAVGREVSALRNAERRRLVFVLLTNTARTGDAHAAFLAGANLVVQMKEVGELPRVLEKNIRDLNELYRDFNRALGLAEL